MTSHACAKLERRMNGALRARSGGGDHSSPHQTRPLHRQPGDFFMLRKLLATSALVVIGAVLIQTANAAEDLKTRQIVVEPAGSHAPDAAALPSAGAGKVE